MDLSGGFSLGALHVPFRLLVIAVTLVAAVLVSRIPLRRHRLLRSRVTDALTNAVAIFAVAWKLTPAVLHPSELLHDPLPLLMAAPGIPGLIIGGIAGCAFLAYALLRRRGVRRASPGPLLLFALVAAGGIGAMELAAAAAPVGPSPRAAAALSLPVLDGSPVSLESLRGRVVVVNFWATWCPPCRSELPALSAFVRGQGAGGALLLAVNLTSSEKSEEAVRAFLRDRKLDFPVPLDLTGAASAAWGVTAYPTTFVVDRGGGISAQHTGAIDEGWLRREIAVAERRPG